MHVLNVSDEIEKKKMQDEVKKYFTETWVIIDPDGTE